MSCLVVVSTFGALTGIILAGPRVYFSLSRDGLAFSWLGAIHEHYRTPHRALVAQAIWAAVLVLTGSYRALFTRVIYTEWIFFGLMALGLLLMRRRAEFAPEFRMWGGHVLPIAFALAAFFIVINQVLVDPGESFVGLGIVATGVPVYYAWTRTRKMRGLQRHGH